MNRRIEITALAAICFSSAVSAQPYQLGKELSADFLEQLIRPGMQRDMISVIHVEGTTAMVIDRNAPDRVVFLWGEGGVLWGQIAKQLPKATARGEPLHLVMRGSTVDSSVCADLTGRVQAFLKELDAVLNDLDGPSMKSNEIVSDSTAFLIQMTVKDAQLTLVPNAPLEPPLQQAAYHMFSTVSGCANLVKSAVEHMTSNKQLQRTVRDKVPRHIGQRAAAELRR